MGDVRVRIIVDVRVPGWEFEGLERIKNFAEDLMDAPPLMVERVAVSRTSGSCADSCKDCGECDEVSSDC